MPEINVISTFMLILPPSKLTAIDMFKHAINYEISRLGSAVRLCAAFRPNNFQQREREWGKSGLSNCFFGSATWWVDTGPGASEALHDFFLQDNFQLVGN